ncbi:uncharacterized protein I206_102381 [Kwoniella pini CBS 10737]|uniref:tRNA (guanine(9)-N1)-methyltransferase n=1 Tax=Kwoniella pini CBS 10737 TaxID=1296096 RepID=A0A1B9I573_9TREE|nr:uncharacterized protein I206_02728 [Kwoniella pini CBS 10737]OCF50673.1 hypothetical protein I206_02728 [Kwoniella pini CBS 10737]
MDEEDILNLVESQQAGPSTSVEIDKPEGMSKNAMKRAAKQARMEELKPLKRAAEKARRKERQTALSKGYTEGTLTEEDKALYEKRKKLEKDRKISKRKFDNGTLNDGEIWNGAIVIDLGFDELMNEQEINSMTSQISYCYSSNRTVIKPIKSIIHTSFSSSASPRLWNKMNDRNWHRWSRSIWWHQGIDELNKVLISSNSKDQQINNKNLDNIEKINIPEIHFDEQNNENQINLDNYLTGPNLPNELKNDNCKLVYLSADSEEEITELNENEIYIIGGIVDRNRYKNLCQNKAENLNIRTARLPIGKFIENLPTRKVLTVNQVFDILLQYIQLNDWQKAFETVIPQRKFHDSKKAKHLHNSEKKLNEIIIENEELNDHTLSNEKELKEEEILN